MQYVLQRNNPKMYQISSSAEVVKNMGRKEISNIAEQVVRNNSDNPFADLPQINVTIEADEKTSAKGDQTTLSSLGLGLPGVGDGDRQQSAEQEKGGAIKTSNASGDSANSSKRKDGKSPSPQSTKRAKLRA